MSLGRKLFIKKGKPKIEQYDKCCCSKYKTLTPLLLSCWQREYDQRPYKRFQLIRSDFEKRMGRPFIPKVDWIVVINEYLLHRCSISLRIECIPFPKEDSLLENLVDAMWKTEQVTFFQTDIPAKLLLIMKENCSKLILTELNLKGNPLLHEHVLSLRCLIANSRTLQTLNVADCNLTEITFAIVADGIHKSKTMHTFDMSRMIRLSNVTATMDTERTASVVSSLIWQNKITDLKMQYCCFTSTDMEVISEYLTKITSVMQSLDLAYNRIGVDGVEYLLQAVVSSGTLRILNISGNGIGSHGGRTIAKYLSSCQSLQNLNISYNGIGSDAMNLIILTLKKPIALTTFCIYGNKFNKRSAYILKRLIEAEVLPKEKGFDVEVTYDYSAEKLHVIPKMPMHLLISKFR